MSKCYFKINSIKTKEKDYNNLPFGRQIEYRHKIAEFKVDAKTTHISQKRQTFKKAFAEFLDLYKPKEYFCLDNTTENYKDDGIQVWYRD